MFKKFFTSIQKRKFSSSSTTTEYYLKQAGLSAETHKIQTDDGYLLQSFRVIHPEFKDRKDMKPVFLQHGFLDSSDGFVVCANDESLAVFLARRGYDVWLGNSRGNKYSMGHIREDISTKEFYDFSYQDMAEFDIPAIQSYILEETNQKINYIGQSQGTTMMFAALSDSLTSEKVHQKLDRFIALAPVVYMFHHKVKLARFLFNFSLEDIYLKKGSYPIHTSYFGHNDNLLAYHEFMSKIVPSVFTNILMATESSSHVNNIENFYKYIKLPKGQGSLKSLLHWKQMAGKKDTFAKLDYGSEELNFEKYGQNTAPEYDFSLMKAKIFLYMGKEDLLIQEEDKNAFIDTLQENGVNFKERVYDNCGHLTFSVGINESQRSFLDIIEDLESDCI